MTPDVGYFVALAATDAKAVALPVFTIEVSWCRKACLQLHRDQPVQIVPVPRVRRHADCPVAMVGRMVLSIVAIASPSQRRRRFLRHRSRRLQDEDSPTGLTISSAVDNIAKNAVELSRAPTCPEFCIKD